MKFAEKRTLECGTSTGELVSYLYAESDERESAKFEEHLAECDHCAGEFAALSLARLEVYEWHRDEFAPIATPRFEVPYCRPAAATSWFGSLSQIFAWNRPVAAGLMAAAMAAVFFGGWMTFFSGAGELGVAKMDNANSLDAGSREIKTVPADLQALKAGAEADRAEADENIETAAPVKAAAIKKTRPAVVKQPKPVRTQPAAPVQAQQRKNAPRLNGTEDEADRTLRLADLLAEIDTDD